MYTSDGTKEEKIIVLYIYFRTVRKLLSLMYQIYHSMQVVEALSYK